MRACLKSLAACFGAAALLVGGSASAQEPPPPYAYPGVYGYGPIYGYSPAYDAPVYGYGPGPAYAPDVVYEVPPVPNRALGIYAPRNEQDYNESRRFFRAINRQSGGP